MMKMLFIMLTLFVTNYTNANVEKDNFKKQIIAKMPSALCKKVATCYSEKEAECESKMKGPVQKCVETGSGYYGKEINPPSGAALDFLIRTCTLRSFATENFPKLQKKNKKCVQFSNSALKY